MKTLRYILSIAVLILGFGIGWVWGTKYHRETHIFYGEHFTMETLFGIGGLLIAISLAILIWPGTQDKRIVLRYIVVTDAFLLLPSFLAFVGLLGGSALGMYIEKTDYAMFEGLIGLLCGASLGFSIAVLLAILILPRNKKQTASTIEMPRPPS